MKKLYLTYLTIYVLHASLLMQAVEAPENLVTTTHTIATDLYNTLDNKTKAQRQAEQKVTHDQTAYPEQTNAQLAQNYKNEAIRLSQENTNPNNIPSRQILNNVLAYEHITGESFDPNGIKIIDTDEALEVEPKIVTQEEQPLLQDSQEPVPSSKSADSQPSIIDQKNPERTTSGETVDFNDSIIEKGVEEKAQAEVKDQFTLRKFINSIITKLFGKNSSNPKLQETALKLEEEAMSAPWWNPWNGSKFESWYTSMIRTLSSIPKYTDVKEKIQNAEFFTDTNELSSDYSSIWNTDTSEDATTLNIRKQSQKK